MLEKTRIPTLTRIERLAIFLQIVKYVEFRTRNMPFQFWKKQINSPRRQRSSAYVSVAIAYDNYNWGMMIYCTSSTYENRAFLFDHGRYRYLCCANQPSLIKVRPL
jgi:hypothetical protein